MPQVVFHSVQVVEVGVQVRVHQDRGVEEDGEGQVEVEREVGEDQGETTSRQTETARSTCRAHSCSLRVSWFASVRLADCVIHTSLAQVH